MDFIEDLRDEIVTNIPTHPRWAEAIAVTLLATAAGPNRYVPTCMGNIKLNMWYVAIGPSGLGYKSLPLRTYARPILWKLSEKIDYELILPEYFSVEGLIEHLAEGHCYGCIIKDEFAEFVKALNKDYLSDSQEFMSKLYDGDPVMRRTKKGGLEVVRGSYICFLGTTTPYFLTLISEDWFRQGLGNRIIYIYYSEEDYNIEREMKIFRSERFFSEDQPLIRESKIEDYAEALLKLYKSKVTTICPDPDVHEEFVELITKLREEAWKRYNVWRFDLLHEYYARLHIHAIKLAALKELSYFIDTIEKYPSQIMPITKESWKWALSRIKSYLKYFKEIYELWRSAPHPSQPETIENMTERIYTLIKESRERGVSWSELRERLKWSREDIIEALKYLWDTEKIVAVLKRSGGRRPVQIYAKEYESYAVQEGKKFLTWSNLRMFLETI